MKAKKLVKAAAWSLGALGVLGAGAAVKTFLPQRFPELPAITGAGEKRADRPSLPTIEVSFLRCGSISIPEMLAVRGAFSLTPVRIAYSAVLIRHPEAVFLYDTGLCGDIHLYLADQPFFFRKTLGNFHFEHSLSDHLQLLNIVPTELDFALISHLHWDHVSGIPDLPGVPLKINRVEYEAAQTNGLLEERRGLVQQLMGKNPLDLFECDGPEYEGFHSSFDLFGDGSVVLVPLPGHTPGNTGMFINRSNGLRLFLIGDAAWVAGNYKRPATMHPFFWSRVTSDDIIARQTLMDLHRYSRLHPEVPLVAMHDGQLQETLMRMEHLHLIQAEEGGK